jgi:hypothetical protein
MIGVHLKRKDPATQVIIMSGAKLDPMEKSLCDEYGFHVLQKPFLVEDAFSLVQARSARTSR